MNLIEAWTGKDSPGYIHTFVDSNTNAPLNLTGATFTLYAQNASNGTITQLSGTWTILSATGGIAQYAWQTTDLQAPGSFYLYASVLLSNETSQRESPPDILVIYPTPEYILSLAGGTLGTDVNIASVGNSNVTYSGGVPADVVDRIARILGHVIVDTLPAISGTVTANAGTNLNTSLLALESGGNLAGIKTDADAISTNTGNTATSTSTTATNTGTIATNTGRIPAQGQAAMAGSLPVTIASNQSAIPATQSGTWTVQPGNTPNTTPWLATLNQGGNSATVTGANALKVDNSAVTQPVSAIALPLPTGAATAAKQPALGTAGTASTDVLSVQGITSMTPLKIDGSAVTQPISGTITANAGTNLNTSALALETGGNLAAAKSDLDSIKSSLVDASTTGSISALNGTVAIALLGGQCTWVVEITGTFSGTLTFQISTDGATTWNNISGHLTGSSTISQTATAAGVWRGNVAGATNFQVIMSAYTSGTANITLRLSSAPYVMAVTNQVQTNLDQINGATLSLGQATKASSLPVSMASDQGAMTVNSNLQAGLALTGSSMTYMEYVAQGLAGSIKLLNANAALTNSGGSNVTINSWKDQLNNTYTTVTTGKTLYIYALKITCDLSSTSGIEQGTFITIYDGSAATNARYTGIATSKSQLEILNGYLSFTQGTTPTVLATPSNLATAVGKLYVQLIGFEA